MKWINEMKKKLEKIKNDKTSGSFKLSIDSLVALRDFIDSAVNSNPEKLAEELNKIGKELTKTQPTMVTLRKNVTHIVYYLKRLIKSEKSFDKIKDETKAKINELINKSEQNKKKIGNYASKLILNNNTVMTISSSSIIKELLIAAHHLNRKFSVYCLESRPLNEGQMFAEELSKEGIQTCIITDASMASKAQESNLVICGADRLYESGFINKIGTLPLAITAQAFKIPMYVACETDKILKEYDRTIRFYPQVSTEIYNSKNKKVDVSNYYFETIPYKYVSKIVCEEGVFETNEFISWYLKE